MHCKILWVSRKVEEVLGDIQQVVKYLGVLRKYYLSKPISLRLETKPFCGLAG